MMQITDFLTSLNFPPALHFRPLNLALWHRNKAEGQISELLTACSGGSWVSSPVIRSPVPQCSSSQPTSIHSTQLNQTKPNQTKPGTLSRSLTLQTRIIINQPNRELYSVKRWKYPTSLKNKKKVFVLTRKTAIL